MVAVILGTGTNACYVERVDAIPKLQDHVSSSGTTVKHPHQNFLSFLYSSRPIPNLYIILSKFTLVQIISTEWGAFSNGLPLTEFDRDMDAASINPGEQVCFMF